MDSTSTSMINCRLQRGGLAEVEKQWQSALDIYLSALPQISEMIDIIIQRMQDAKAQQAKEETIDESHHNKAKSTDTMQEYITNLSVRHHKWISLLHRFYFFIAGIYHQLAMEDEESEYYSKAADIRRQILSRAEERVSFTVINSETLLIIYRRLRYLKEKYLQ